LSKIARKVIGQSQMASEFNDYKGSPLCAFLSRYIISDQRFFSFFLHRETHEQSDGTTARSTLPACVAYK